MLNKSLLLLFPFILSGKCYYSYYVFYFEKGMASYTSHALHQLTNHEIVLYYIIFPIIYIYIYIVPSNTIIIMLLNKTFIQ